MKFPRMTRVRTLLAITGVLAIASAVVVGRVTGSDHQDTPDVELSPQLDINDVFAFPGSSEDRIALVVTMQSPITPAGTTAARFDPNALYQVKIDNSSPLDGIEDLVIQFAFDDAANGGQTVNVIGPIRPGTTGMRNTMAAASPTLTGAFNATFGSATAMQVFAGPRDDPFYLDLEQFFRIVPDRRPSRGPLSTLTKSASAFRSATATATPPFEAGPAVDYLRGLNTLALVVELPESQLRSATGNNNIGIWATVSR